MLEEKTKNQINDLINNFENSALKLMVSEALKTWNEADINPGNGCYGVDIDHITDIYIPTEERCPCILGAAIIGQKSDNNQTEETITNIFGLGDDEIEMVIEVFDYHPTLNPDILVSDRKTLVEIRDLLEIDKNSNMTFNRENLI